ncbi:hypothetical protein FKW77_009320 [Venturia effusa]|uniref:Uncharacterized protein n=1 Tax=Venturia effusa TaxID=50376 RepID=A0A517LCY6_9PEZI|nr:hypothetical protein FKW77_009320 [Venturia effusa]
MAVPELQIKAGLIVIDVKDLDESLVCHSDYLRMLKLPRSNDPSTSSAFGFGGIFICKPSFSTRFERPQQYILLVAINLFQSTWNELREGFAVNFSKRSHDDNCHIHDDIVALDAWLVFADEWS